ncbi:unnamed protein product [Polarella glacialis]|uniref:Uncharacterized protein n=1 Tax=Polarella glacialis TaxID=89957 RepID=A0A813HM58_POLGL|nr:unnamed protein product [Polarella glacialis]CAE8638629.1 unnamed protein product [Polarella glacialis]
MRGEWFDTVSNCVTFSIAGKAAKHEQVMNFRHALVRIMSLCHGSALEEISGNVFELEVIDIMGLDVKTLQHIRDCTVTHGFNKVEVCVHLVQSLIIQAHDEGVLKVAPPILSRVFQTTSRGFVNILNTKKITDTKFPYPFAQIIAFFLLIHCILTPVMLAAVIKSPWIAPVFTFLVILGFFAMNFISIELENPFGRDANDLPLWEFQQEMNSCLLMLLHPNADLIVRTSKDCNMDFFSLQKELNDPDDGEEKQRAMTPRLSRLVYFGDAELERTDSEQSSKAVVTPNAESVARVSAAPSPCAAAAVKVKPSAPAPVAPQPLPSPAEIQQSLMKNVEEFKKSMQSWNDMVNCQTKDLSSSFGSLMESSNRIPKLLEHKNKLNNKGWEAAFAMT